MCTDVVKAEEKHSREQRRRLGGRGWQGCGLGTQRWKRERRSKSTSIPRRTQGSTSLLRCDITQSPCRPISQLGLVWALFPPGSPTLGPEVSTKSDILLCVFHCKVEQLWLEGMYKPPKATLKHVKYHLHTFKKTYLQIISYSPQAHKYILNIP